MHAAITECMQPQHDFAHQAELLTVKEAAQFLKVPVSWIYEHVRPDAVDRLPAMKLGKYLRFDARDLYAYVDAKRHTSDRVSRSR
jgi:excisionase family DNA binding protein